MATPAEALEVVAVVGPALGEGKDVVDVVPSPAGGPTGSAVGLLAEDPGPEALPWGAIAAGGGGAPGLLDLALVGGAERAPPYGVGGAAGDAAGTVGGGGHGFGPRFEIGFWNPNRAAPSRMRHPSPLS